MGVAITEAKRPPTCPACGDAASRRCAACGRCPTCAPRGCWRVCKHADPACGPFCPSPECAPYHWHQLPFEDQPHEDTPE